MRRRAKGVLKNVLFGKEVSAPNLAEPVREVSFWDLGMWAGSSAGERSCEKREPAGSNPARSTIPPPLSHPFLLPRNAVVLEPGAR